MPGIIIQDKIKLSSIPGDTIKMLEELENKMRNEDISKKEYCDKKWSLLKPHAEVNLIDEIEQLQADLESTNILENDYCSEMMRILQVNLRIHSPIKGNGSTFSNDATSPKFSGSPKTYGRASRTPRSKPVLETESPVAGPSRTPASFPKKLAAFRASPRNGDSPSGSKRKSVEEKEDSKPGPSTRRSSAKKLALENEESTVMTNSPKGPGKRASGKQNGQKNFQKNTLNSWFKKNGSDSTVNDSDNKKSNELMENENELKTSDIIGSSEIVNETSETNDVEVKKEPESPVADVVSPKLQDSLTESEKTGLTNENTNQKDVTVVDEDENARPSKKIKKEDIEKEDSTEEKPDIKVNAGGRVVPQKCDICRQLLGDPDTRLYPGHPHDAVEEYIALTDPKLSLFTGDEGDIHEHDARPQNKITQYSVYDKAGHLCPIDGGLIERNVLLYFSGYMKPVYEENPEAEGGIPAKDMGPINEWWVSGYDGGERALIGFSTDYGEYYLMEPSEAYAPLMETVKQKIYMGKLVIEFLLEDPVASYEDLLNKLQTTVPPFGTMTLSEDNLLRHAQFICDQVLSFDEGADNSDDLLITSPCMRALVNLAGVTFGKRRVIRQRDKKDFKQKKTKQVWSKATTTPLVSDVFESLFTDQLDTDASLKGPKRRRCNVCEACQSSDCGSCTACKDMIKFGGSGRSKQACVKRRCPNMAIQEADEDEPEDDVDGVLPEDESSNMSWTSSHRHIKTKTSKKTVEWVGDPVKDDGRKIYYSKVKVGEEEISVGDCITVEPNDPGTPVFIGRVIYMWQDKSKEKFFHAHWFCRGSDTVLGETSDPQELFLLDECEDSMLSAVGGLATVTHVEPPSGWASLGGQPLAQLTINVGPDNGKTFYYQKKYDPLHARFEDIPADPPCLKAEAKHRFCPCCERLYTQQKKETPSVDERFNDEGNVKEVLYGVVRWKGEEYRPGTFVFLTPGVFKFKNGFAAVLKNEVRKPEKVDEDLYPEYYRKSSDHVKGSNDSTPEPFCVGYISAIVTKTRDKLVAPGDICVRVKKMYRPENTHKDANLSHQLDLNQLYWTDEERLVNFTDVMGRCHVIFGDNLEDSMTLPEWTAAGPYRFYFNQAYDSVNHAFVDPPPHATLIGSLGKGKGKGKGKSSLKPSGEERKEGSPEGYPQVRPLKCLDVFAGCGGLSEGFHQAGVAETCWAIEKEEAAAHAFRLNNPNTTVFTEDCNLLLKLAMNGEKTNKKGQVLPQKGEVELLCGGPPCQGFSGMNRFNSRQYSLFKNSLIVSYLSYCDYYRPRFFILENVRNFVSFKRSMVLKLTLRCLVRMGYQCTFGVLQAGNYGVPQTRRRAIIIAAAPGEGLPNYPEPTHTFNLRATSLNVMIDDKKFSSKCQWVDSAPLRTITVRDAMSDLPEIRNGAKNEEMGYGGEPESHFQRLIRGNQYQPVLRDHVCKEMAPLVEARIANIPTKPGSDWRDLPNLSVRLSDGTLSKKLQYTHHDKKNGKSSTGALRGVCTCATGGTCDPMDRQYNTLIPWCLPHTGNRHNHWAGLYGRVEWDGFFSTTVTNPEPMGKQGRVLHPTQTRVVSVRECARSQGFPDTYRFFGGILDKHRQIGNAVPPPMGKAIGLEIRKCVATNSEDKKKLE